MNTKPRIRVPKTAKKGELITIRALIAHPMESGLSKNHQGKRIKRNIIHRFCVHFNQLIVFESHLGSSIAANPYFQFEFMVSTSGVFNFQWHDDNGTIYTAQRKLNVTDG